MEKKNYYQVNSLVKAFSIIETLSSQSEFDLAELSRVAKMPKPTVHRMVLTLQQLGYVRQNPNNQRYFLSSKLFEVGCRIITRKNYVEIAHQVMGKLSDLTSETIYLGILDGLDVVVVDKIESKHSLKQSFPLGERYRAYASAGGKAILAGLPPDVLDQMFENHEFEKLTEKSVSGRNELMKELDKINTRGYAVDDEEFMPGIRCVAAGLFDHQRNVVAGLSISGPTSRIKKRDITKLAKLVVEAANSITGQLGGRIPLWGKRG